MHGVPWWKRFPAIAPHTCSSKARVPMKIGRAPAEVVVTRSVPPGVVRLISITEALREGDALLDALLRFRLDFFIPIIEPIFFWMVPGWDREREPITLGSPFLVSTLPTCSWAVESSIHNLVRRICADIIRFFITNKLVFSLVLWTPRVRPTLSL